MADDSDEMYTRAPAMLCLTSVLKPPPQRWGGTKNFRIGRTLPLKDVVACSIGAVIGLFIATIVGGIGINSLVFGPIVGGAVAYLVANAKPYGVPTWEAAFIWVTSRRAQTGKYRGKKVGYAVGVCPVPQSNIALGQKIRLVSSSVDVYPDQFDDRGVLRTAQNKNLPNVDYRANWPKAFTRLFPEDNKKSTSPASVLRDLSTRQAQTTPNYLSGPPTNRPPVSTPSDAPVSSVFDRLSESTQDQSVVRPPLKPKHSKKITAADRLSAAMHPDEEDDSQG